MNHFLKMRRKITIILLLGYFNLAPFLFAQQSLPEIQIEVVEKKIKEEEAKNPTRFISVLKTEKAQEENKTVDEVLNESAGVQVKRWGGLGAFSTVSIRGSSANQVEIYLDGIPLNLAWSGITNLADLNLDCLEKMEIYRGFAPVEFSRSSIGGVVNLVSRKAQGESVFELRGTAGSFDTYKLNLLGSQAFKKWDWLAFYTHLQSRGNFEYESDNGTPLNPDDDYTARRENNDFIMEDLIFKPGGKIAGWRWDLLNNFYYKDQGIAGLDINPYRHTRLTTKRIINNLQIKPEKLLGKSIELSAQINYLWQEERYKDKYGEAGLGKQDQLNLTESYGTDINFAWYPEALEFLRTGIEARREWFRAKELIAHFTSAPQIRYFFSAGIEAGISSQDKKMLIVPSLRYQHCQNKFKGEPYFTWSKGSEPNNKTYDYLDPSLGVRFSLLAGLIFKGNIGAGHRMPTFYELFGDRGVVVGNSQLEPEKALNYDFGFQYQKELGEEKKAYLQMSYFQSQIKDMILFFQNSQRTVIAINIGEALIQGIEISAGANLSSHWKVSGNYTYQNAVDTSDITYWSGKKLPFRPAHEAYLRFGWERKNQVRIWLEGNYTSENYWDRANLFSVPSRTIINLGAMGYFKVKGTNLKVGAEVKNLLDQKISDIAGWPMPGRTYFITISWKF